MNAVILSIGDELVLGQTVDTNSAWLSREIAAIGVRPVRHITVSDDQASIEQGIRDAIIMAPILLISGGLGPTEDDLTRQALAAVMNAPLEMNDAALKNVRRFFRLIKRDMPERNAIQAMLPRGSAMIENTCGTAPGIKARLGDCEVFIMPGVPKEMKAMYTLSIAPLLRELTGGGVVLSKMLHTFGVGESVIAEKLAVHNLMARDRNPSVGTTVSGGVVSLRINAYFNSRERAEKELAETERLCREALGDLVYGVDDESLQEAVIELIGCRLPNAPELFVATAESCTGGLLAKYLTDVPGCSKSFKFGWVTYANEAKTQELGVPESVLKEHGAVSEQTVRAMAEGARRQSRATYALAISGIAGPDGGTPTKPVGTVCIALASDTGTDARTSIFPGDREMIRDRSAKMALTMLRFALLNKPMPF
jgi:nicotinamide-nucleotide amidase